MATLADVQTGDQFLFACQVTSVDPTAGIGLSLYGPGRSLAATATIAVDGSMTGSLAMPPNQVPINIVTGFTPLSVGDLLENSQTGETLVCRWSEINPDGSVIWSASASGKVIYPASGWTVVGHCNL